MRSRRSGRFGFYLTLLLSLSVLIAGVTVAQTKITSPKEQFGFNIGDDYQLANYTQLVEHWQKLARESDRIKLVEIGKTAEGRTMWMAIISSPENLRNLEKYRQTARRLALAEGVSDEEARRLAAEGRAVVWIDGGLHATETLGAQQLIETVYQLVSRSDAETMRFLNDVIVLATLVNPDGMELVSNWYMRDADPLKRSLNGLPRLYQKYIGHDNNRDFYLSSQPETEAVNRIFYHEWFPQIVYNHHQTGPAGTILFAPPFRDPFNYLFDPMVVSGIDLVGAAMHGRFLAEDKPGATSRSGTLYSTWWNGGLRTTVYFHNMIGLLTETIGNPTPMEVPFVPARQLPKGDLISPVTPQKWHFRQSIEYSLTANRAVIDIASKHREDFLYNIYRMGRNSIERGSRDTWTMSPHRIAEVQALAARERQATPGRSGADAGGDGPPDAGQFGGGGAAGRPVAAKYFEMLRKPEDRDPRGYVIPSSQPDFATATKFINALIKTGITVLQADRSFEVAGKSYPARSYVIKTAQAFRPHIIDMFEPQEHPNDFAYPGGPPIPPYDSAGWTLAFQMGVQFDRILDGFDAPFQKIKGFADPALSLARKAANPAGFLIRHEVNDAFIAVNKVLKIGGEVYWLKQPITVEGQTFNVGTHYIPAKPGVAKVLDELLTRGVPYTAIAIKPVGEALQLRPVRIALWDRYGGSMPSGWTRWIFEQFEFPFTVVYPQTLDGTDLANQFDVLVLVTGAVPSREGGRGGGGGGGGGFAPNPDSIPAEYRAQLGNISIARTVPQLRKFLDAGGSIITIGSSSSLATHLGLPVSNALVERNAEGVERPLTADKFYVPGSLLQASVDTTQPLAYGMPDKIDVFFDNSPVFRLRPEAVRAGYRPVAWFGSDHPLRSGWAWGQKYLQDGVAVIDAPVGKGKLLMFGPEIAFRAQPHGTFKFLFNGIYLSRAEPVILK
ncbi:MAG: M14 metallopeptidase family protein [Acidobacteriota bacterium]